MKGSDKSVAAVIRRLRKAMLSDGEPGLKAVAEVTRGLPVYGDTGGYLAIREDGEVVRYNAERRTAEREESEQWRVLARLVASEKFPELVALRPERPADARGCYVCRGRGTVLYSVKCGTCWGLGWRP